MRMKKLLLAATVALALGGCATIQNLEGEFKTITTTTVQPSYANIAINTYLGLKATATGYGTYCIQNKFPAPICSAANRRAVISFVKAGDGAKAQLDPLLVTGAPIPATIYNTIVGAINGLKASPITQTTGN